MNIHHSQDNTFAIGTPTCDSFPWQPIKYRTQSQLQGKKNNKDPRPSSFRVILDIFEIFSVLFQNQLCHKVDRKVVLSTTVYVVCAYVYQYIILSFKLQMNKTISSLFLAAFITEYLEIGDLNQAIFL